MIDKESSGSYSYVDEMSSKLISDNDISTGNVSMLNIKMSTLNIAGLITASDFQNVNKLFRSDEKDSIPLKVIKVDNKSIIQSHLKKLYEENIIDKDQIEDINNKIKQYIDYLIADKNIQMDNESYDWLTSFIINLIYETNRIESEP